MTKSLEDRVTELEVQLAHAQRSCEQLNDVVTQLSLEAQRRDRLVDRLVSQLKDLKEKVQEPNVDGDEKPPHY